MIFVCLFVCFLFKETSKEQYYPNVFVLLSVSILRKIVLNDLMAPGGNPVERMAGMEVTSVVFLLIDKINLVHLA